MQSRAHLPGKAKNKHGLNGQPAAILDGALKEFAERRDPTKQTDPSILTSGRPPLGDTTSFSRVNVLA